MAAFGPSFYSTIASTNTLIGKISIKKKREKMLESTSQFYFFPSNQATPIATITRHKLFFNLFSPSPVYF